MAISLSKSKGRKKSKISAVEILKYGNAIESSYKSRLSSYNYEVRRNLNMYLTSKLDGEIIGVDLLLGDVILRLDTIFKNIVVSVKNRDNIYVKYPTDFMSAYKEAKVILAAISDILLKYYDSCLEFKSFKTDVRKMSDVKGKYDMEISSTGIFLCSKYSNENRKVCSVLYGHCLPNTKPMGIISVTKEEKKLLESLNFFVDDCPTWVVDEYAKNSKHYKKRKEHIIKKF